MKKILGLDIGTTSIGWAIVEATDEKKANDITGKTADTDINNDRIGIHKDAVGVRIISQDTANLQSFNKGEKLVQGNTLTPTANRRVKRASRRLKSRYKLRRGKLENVLSFLGITKDEKYYTNERKFDEHGRIIKRGDNNDIGKALYELRDRAIREKISLAELGRVLLHLNQWRGYSSDRFSVEEKPKFDYLITQLIEVDSENKIAHFDKEKKEELRYYQIAVKIKFEEPYNLGDIENPNTVLELNGLIFKKEIDFKVGDIVTIKAPEFKQDKKGKNIIAEYYKFTLTEPDPTDWNYKYQTLQKTLTEWCNSGKTLGSFFYHNFYEQKNIERIRNNVVNRSWYEKEFDKIWNLQFDSNKEYFEKFSIEEIIKAKGVFKNYQAILTEVKKKDSFKEQLKYLIKEKIIFYQRPWQQAKNKGQCPFEKKLVKKEKNIKGTGKKEIVEVYVGRTVIPKSHPLFQEFRIWQQINNVRVYLGEEKKDLFADGVVFKKHIGKEISEVKELLFNELQNAKSVTWRSFAENELGLKKKEIIDETTGEVLQNPFSYNYRKKKKNGDWDDIKLKGNTTKVSLQKILINKPNEWFSEIHSSTQQISNLQLLWEIIYDITNSDVNKVSSIIKKHFGFDDSICLQLAKIKFDDIGMGNLSAKAIRHILPMMSNGKNLTDKAKNRINSLITLNESDEEKTKDADEKLEGLRNFITDKKARLRLSQFIKQNQFTYLNYWEATAVMYGSHSSKNTTTKSEISRVENHSMNNPVVEKIVNETISIVNEIYKAYGFDEVRIELSRELKASMDERAQMDEAMRNSAKRNELAKRMLRELFNADASINNIDKLKIYEDEAKQMTKERFEELKAKGEIKKETDFEKFEDVAKKLNLKEPSKADIIRYQLWLDQMCQCPYTGEIIRLSDIFTAKYEIEHIIPRERYLDNSYSNKVITRKVVNKWKDNRLAYEFIIQEGGKAIKDISDNKTLNILELDKKTNEGSYKDLVTKLFHKGRKLQNLLRKEPPEEPINRELKDTQYINKKLKEKLSELVGESKVWTTTGTITDILRDSWHLNEVMKELLRDRYKEFKIPLGSGKEPTYGELSYKDKRINKKTEEEESIEIFPGYSKRLDHRHHALDAFIIACTKQWHIQYVNTMNAANSANISNDDDKKKKAVWLKHQVCEKNEVGDYKSSKFEYPWSSYNKTQIENVLKEIVVAHKNTNLLISPSKHRIKRNGELLTVKRRDGSIDVPISIRGQMHNETIIGKRKFFNPATKTIEEIIDEIFLNRQNARNNLKPVLSFDDLIEQIVFKEKYQKKLKEIFRSATIQNNDEDELQKIIQQYIKENKHNLFDWATTISYLPVKTGTDKQGGIDKIDIDNVTDPRIKRFLEYRRNLITSIEEKKELLKKENGSDEEIKKWEIIEKDSKNFTIYPIYYNAIYDVRLNDKTWHPLDELNDELLNNIEYLEKRNSKEKRTDLIKNVVKSYFNKKQVDKLIFRLEYLVYNPLFLNEKTIKIPVKKASTFNKTKEETLYPIRPGAYVELANNFMVYMFEKQENECFERQWNLLTVMDALNLKLDTRNKIKNENLFPNELIPKGFHQIFTLSKKDIVFIPFYKGAIEETYNKEELSELFNWIISESNTKEKIHEKKKVVVKNLWQVTQFSKTSTGNSINFKRINTAKEITIPIVEIRTDRGELSESAINRINKMKQIFLTTSDTKKKKDNSIIEEDIIPYNQILFQNCIKVFNDKLGKKVVPYWEFPNGCWNEQRAIELGLINN